jgi:hypothetical protein
MSFGGFDCSEYTHDSARHASKDDSTYRFAGCYMSNPSHGDKSWKRKHQLLMGMRSGFTVVCGGQGAS